MQALKKLVSFGLLALLVALTSATTAHAQTQDVPIVDPVLRMTAWTVSVPSNWKASGTMLGGSACNNGESPVIRAVSPDGLTGMYFLPRIDWCWGPGIPPNGASFAKGEVSAKEVTNFIMQTRKLAFVQNVPTAITPEQLRQSDAQLSHPGYVVKSDNLKTRVRYEVNGQSIDEILQVMVSCTKAFMAAIGEQHTCNAFVIRKFAPTKNFEAILATFDKSKLVLNQAWNNAWNEMMRKKIAGMYDASTQQLLEYGRRAEEARMQEHREYMNYMNQRSDQMRGNFEASQYRKRQNTEDFVDHILDCQRYYGQNVRVDGGNCPDRQTW